MPVPEFRGPVRVLGLISCTECDPTSDIMYSSRHRAFGKVTSKELLSYSCCLSRDALGRNSGGEGRRGAEVVIVQMALEPRPHEPGGGNNKERVRGWGGRGCSAETKRAVSHGLRGYPGGPANAVDVHLQLGGGRPAATASSAAFCGK